MKYIIYQKSMMKRSQLVKSKPNTLAPPKSQKPKCGLMNKGLKSKSDDSLDTSNRKASTPTHEVNKVRAASPDISCIMPNESMSSGSTKSGAVKRLQLKGPMKTGPAKEENLDDKLSFEYTRLIQLMMKKKIAEREAADIDENLSNLKKRIEQNQIILEKATERLKNITFNKEVDLLHSLRNPNYGKVLENLESTKCKEYLETLNEKLEQAQDKLKVQNIELPESGGAELLEVFNETLASCEKLQANNTLEIPKLIEDIKRTNRDTTETLSRCIDKIPKAEDHILSRALMEMSSDVNPL